MTQNTQRIYALSAVQIVSDVPIAQYEIFEKATLREDFPTVRLSCTQSPFPKADFRLIAEHSTLTVQLAEGFWVFTVPGSEAQCELRLSIDYKQICVRRSESCHETVFLQLLQAAMECISICYGVLSLHSACVLLDDKAVAFTAASGTGKSTRAQAWKEALGARILSGDRPQLRISETEALVCGVPWDGKEQIFSIDQVPLFALLEVHRAGFVRVRRMSEKQIFAVLTKQCFIPMWDSLLAAKAISLIRKAARTVPMYRLFCGPDKEDARAVHRILFTQQDQIKEEGLDMQIKKGFVLHNVVDEYMVVPAGDNIGTYNGTVILNEVSAFIWNQLLQPISYEDLLDCILAEYDTDRETAAHDLDKLLDQFREYDLLEE